MTPDNFSGFQVFTCFTCFPEDYFEVISSCDNFKGVIDFECQYIKRVGTNFSEEAVQLFDSNGRNIGDIFTNPETFFRHLGDKMSVSLVTG